MVTKAKPLGLPLSLSWGMKQSCRAMVKQSQLKLVIPFTA